MAAPSFRATSSGASASLSVSVTYPTGTVSGDYVLAWVYCGDFDLTPGGTITIPTPTGWTLIQDDTTGVFRGAAVFGKFSAGESSDTFTFTQPTTAAGNLPGIRVQLSSYSGVDTVNPVHVATKTAYSAGTSTTVVSPTSPTTVNDVMIARYACGSASTTRTVTWIASTAEIFDGSTDFTDNFAIQSGTTAVRATATSPGSTDTATFSSTGAAHRIAMVVGLQPPQDLTVNGSDGGSLADTATVAASLPVTDGATGTDSASIKVAPTADTGTLSDSASVAVSGASDGGSLSDTATVAAALPVTDTGTFTENATVSIAFQVSDTGTLSDSASVGVAAADSGTLTDTATVTAAMPATDSGSLADTAQVALSPPADAGTLTDSASIAVQATDTGTFSDFAVIAVGTFGTDGGTLTDDARVIVHASDSGQLFDSAARTDEGRLIKPRLYRVPAEDRTIEVAADPRTFRVKAEDGLR